MKKKDTIFALASGPGKAAISIIRISGPESIKTINSLSLEKIKKPRETKLIKLFSSSGELIDQTITTIFKKAVGILIIRLARNGQRKKTEYA